MLPFDTRDTRASLTEALAALEGERKRLDEAAAAIALLLAELARRSPRHVARGRRPVPKKAIRRKPKWTAAMKAAARARMRTYWAKKKKKGE